MSDTELRYLERLALTERTVPNLVRLQLARYRAGLVGVGRPKLESWWQAAHRVLAEGENRPPVHPHFMGEPNKHRLHGHYTLYNVAFCQYFDQNRIPETNIAEIILGDRDADRFGSGSFPAGLTVRAFLLDSDTLIMVHPSLDNYYDLLKHVPHSPWPEDLLEENDYETLEHILS